MTTPAQAVKINAVATASGFDPGNIVSDAVFFDGSALSAKQVQAFLNARVPVCHKTAAGPTCLRHHKQGTPTMPADAFCRAYKGKASETAARIIAKIGKACNVSPKALLVLLEKEQSLVTAGSTASNVPTAYKYQHATGFACPDTAPCDPKYSGIFYQLYYGARQYQRYAKDSFFSWRQIGMNTIAYHPNNVKYQPSSPNYCPAVQVNVRNQATLGLYYYTPYVPNKAALDNMYSTGDRCSSYGNRNFYRIFNDWFGSSQIPVRGGIQEAWIASGSHAGPHGRPRANPQCSAKGYCVQRFQSGYIATTAKGVGFRLTNAAFITAWQNAGGVSGSLGWPRTKEVCSTNGCRQRFTGGEVAAARNASPIVIPERIAKTWRAAKTFKGTMGSPRRAAVCTKAGNCRQRFAGGFIVSPAKGTARLVRGAFATYWAKAANRSAAGLPIGQRSCWKYKVGKGKKAKNVTTCQQRFAKGRVVVRASGAARLVPNGIAPTWYKNRKKLGYPIRNASCTTLKSGQQRCTQKFKGGRIAVRGKKVKVTRL